MKEIEDTNKISTNTTSIKESQILSGQDQKIRDDINKLSLKEKAERATASCVLIHNLEYQRDNFGKVWDDQDRKTWRFLNTTLDILMSDPDVRYYVENEIKMAGTPVVWTPGDKGVR